MLSSLKVSVLIHPSIQLFIHPQRSRVEDPTTKAVATRSLRGAPLIAFLASRRDSSLSFHFSLLLSSPDLPSACCDCTDRGFSHFLTCGPFEWLANSDFEAKEGEGAREKKEEEGTGVGGWGTTVYSKRLAVMESPELTREEVCL